VNYSLISMLTSVQWTTC